MGVRSGADLIAEILISEGVSHVFGNPGTTELPLLEAIERAGALTYVLCLQEAAALSMAGGHALAARGLSVALLHAAPGLGNAMGMLYDAAKAGAPMLVICGQHDQEFCTTEPVLWGELPAMAAPLVKWQAEIRSAVTIPRILRRAAKVAMTVPTGPVFVSVPQDVMKTLTNVPAGVPNRVLTQTAPPDAEIDALAARIARSEAPVIIAGDAVEQSSAQEQLAEFAELVGAPVYTENIANTTPLPPRHPLARGAIGRLAPGVRKNLERHDLLISVGADLMTLSLPHETDPVPEDIAIVHIDTDPWELGKTYTTETSLLADPALVLTALSRRLASDAGLASGAARRMETERETAREARAALEAEAMSADRSLVDALALYYRLSDRLPDGTIIVEEAISLARGIREFLVGPQPASFFGLRGGGIGWGLSAAIGIRSAQPQRPVLALIGDGSAHYNIQALWTAAHEKLAVTFVILNNNGYRILDERSGRQGSLIAVTAIREPRVDFVAIARGYGLNAERVETLDGAADVIIGALDRTESTLIEVAVRRSY
ncbi:thiamine pyrophosphate-binding protein [Pseudoruegeria sp. HB172150]|uniref:thiamine pyrophosphate-binding protein n=1 Tax=Pseudoruegeria sp. HB172150 TaxID=2721164 RepID=UPI001555C786|nr:thiamine pyrophosphate-binding protein [Pseudoruegeria sp. HB172150]